MTICRGAQLRKAGSVAADRSSPAAIKSLNKQAQGQEAEASGTYKWGEEVSHFLLSPLHFAGERGLWTHSSAGLSLGRISSPPASRRLGSPQRTALIPGLWWDFGWSPQVRKSGLRRFLLMKQLMLSAASVIKLPTQWAGFILFPHETLSPHSV